MWFSWIFVMLWILSFRASFWTSYPDVRWAGAHCAAWKTGLLAFRSISLLRGWFHTGEDSLKRWFMSHTWWHLKRQHLDNAFNNGQLWSGSRTRWVLHASAKWNYSLLIKNFWKLNQVQPGSKSFLKLLLHWGSLLCFLLSILSLPGLQPASVHGLVTVVLWVMATEDLKTWATHLSALWFLQQFWFYSLSPVWNSRFGRCHHLSPSLESVPTLL